MFRRFRQIAAVLFACAIIAAVILPGPQHALFPAWSGMVRAAPGIWTDDPAFIEQARNLAARAQARTENSFGDLRADPRLVFCTKQACAERLSVPSGGITYGYHLILFGPKGLNETIATHERLHAELHSYMDLSDLLDQRFPAWFDEGLASHWSGDNRLNRPDDPRDADWIRTAHSFRDWFRLHPGRNWRVSYGAAARLVEEIETEIGREGIAKLIRIVGEGSDFDTTLADLRKIP